MISDRLKKLSTMARSFVGTNGMSAQIAAMRATLDRVEHATRGEAAPAQLLDFNMMLHQSRGAMLREMPPGAHRLLSAGCAGNWYFDWIAQCYGHVPDHVGIEFYTPRPDTLPDNVTWIANTASNMEAVESASCDLVFSGQNMEHLWGHEVAGFLVEAARVLKPGGHLAVDSPNRVITQPLNWSHPEHTIELTVPEIRRLLELAGFDVTKEVGLWLCRDPKSGRLLPFDPNVPDPDWSTVERLIEARHHPEHAFVWWLEGQRTTRAPDRAAIDALLAEAYSHAWPERIRRSMVPAGHKVETRADGEWIVMAPGQTGVALYGPYMPLRAGRHTITFHIDPPKAADGVFAVCDICLGPEATVMQRQEVSSATRQVSFEIELAALEFGAQFRCFSTTGGFAVKRHVTLVEELA